MNITAQYSPTLVESWRKKSGIGAQLQTTQTYPVYYQAITKCGCTYIKNLLYYLDHGKIHDAGDRIHKKKADLKFATGISDSEIKNSPYNFIVIRNPIDRFVSLYFDKLYDTSIKGNSIQKGVINNTAFSLDKNLSVEDHQRNCMQALSWIGKTLNRSNNITPNWHWKRQALRLGQVSKFNFHILTLDGLSEQLPKILSPLIPDIAEKMEAVRSRNSSAKPVSKGDLLNEEIITEVHTLYSRDFKVYNEVSSFWASQALKGA